jgi:AraC-like DNA-binding protein
LRAAGIAPTVVADPAAVVPNERVHDFVALLLERSGDPTLGLAAGRHYNLATFGLLGAVAAVMPSPRDVVRLFVKYQHLTFTFFLLELDEATQRLLLVATDDLGPLHRFYLDRELSFVLRTARRLWPTSYRQLLAELVFDYPPPPEIATYRSYFGVPLRFDGDCAGVRIDFAAEPPPSTLNPLGTSELERQLESFASVEGDVVQRTRNAVLVSVGARRHLPTLDEIGARIGRSARTLRRELDARGTSFRDITDEVVVTLARRYLRDPSLSVDIIAERLGYAEASSFLRAFRRITGRTITSMRR